jgi:hypothetical protein
MLPTPQGFFSFKKSTKKFLSETSPSISKDVVMPRKNRLPLTKKDMVVPTHVEKNVERKSDLWAGTEKNGREKNSLIDHQEKDVGKKVDRKSDFWAGVENEKKVAAPVALELKESFLKEPKKFHVALGNMWLDFVEAKIMPAVACGDINDDTTATGLSICEETTIH